MWAESRREEGFYIERRAYEGRAGGRLFDSTPQGLSDVIHSNIF
jgi:hypothetical protein